MSASCSLPIATELHHRQPAATVVDGGAHGGELVLKEDDVHADAGEERVLLLQQFAELPRKLVHHARQSRRRCPSRRVVGGGLHQI
jgi:hypothetical protein